MIARVEWDNNGHGHGHKDAGLTENHAKALGKPRGKLGDTFVEGLGFIAAEGVSMVTSLGVVAVADVIAPNVVKKTSHMLSKSLIEPHLDGIEWLMTKICKLDECKVDPSKTREERSERIARYVVLFTPAWMLSMLAKIKTRQFINEHSGIQTIPDEIKQMSPWSRKRMFYASHADKCILAADEVVHIGSFVVMNSVGHKANDAMIKASSSMLQKTLGWSKQKADDVAVMGVVWELPNVAGTIAGLAAITGKHYRGWFPEKPPKSAVTPQENIAAAVKDHPHDMHSAR